MDRLSLNQTSIHSTIFLCWLFNNKCIIFCHMVMSTSNFFICLSQISSINCPNILNIQIGIMFGLTR
uniref:Candidate secreted effector n=1 Tax=Meloidogyne incognita TaxID=6306 RepID=A0A914MRW1_MELIC